MTNKNSNRYFVLLVLLVLSANFCFAEENSSIDINSSRVSRVKRQPRMQSNKENNSQMFRYSTTIEKECPQLDEETKKLISEYRKNPTNENYNELRKKVESNYDKVLERKKAKLEELKQTAKDSYKIDEMREIVDEMVNDRENRINQSMSRFTDSRLRPGSREVKDDGYLPVLGAGQNVNIAYTPVTNEEYAKFIKDTGRTAPQNWVNGNFPNNQNDFPVVYISYNDAVEYCKWLSQKDGTVKYRLPTETEWELAAGHMPKDADFNSGKTKGLTSVNAYSKTLSACGAIDMWGNVWEWTSTSKDKKAYVVKGGSYSTPRTSCRTENRSETRDANKGYDTVGFRVVKEYSDKEIQKTRYNGRPPKRRFNNK